MKFFSKNVHMKSTHLNACFDLMSHIIHRIHLSHVAFRSRKINEPILCHQQKECCFFAVGNGFSVTFIVVLVVFGSPMICKWMLFRAIKRILNYLRSSNNKCFYFVIGCEDFDAYENSTQISKPRKVQNSFCIEIHGRRTRSDAINLLCLSMLAYIIGYYVE